MKEHCREHKYLLILKHDLAGTERGGLRLGKLAGPIESIIVGTVVTICVLLLLQQSGFLWIHLHYQPTTQQQY